MNIENWVKNKFDKSVDWVLITGGTSGIGLEYLKRFLALDCRCVVVANDTHLLQDLAATARGSLILHNFDLSTVEGISDAITAVSNYQVRVLINNAGFGIKGPFLDTPWLRYAEIVNVNSIAGIAFSHQCLPGMVSKKNGLHIWIATINVLSPIPYNTVYTATKHLVYCVARSIAHEYRSSEVNFQIVLPGTTDTPFHEKQGAKPSAMVMSPREVVAYSLADVTRSVSIPNAGDRVLKRIAWCIPEAVKIRISVALAAKRLGLSYE